MEVSGSAVLLFHWQYIDGLVQDCCISFAHALAILQSCTKWLICSIDIVICEISMPCSCYNFEFTMLLLPALTITFLLYEGCLEKETNDECYVWLLFESLISFSLKLLHKKRQLLTQVQTGLCIFLFTFPYYSCRCIFRSWFAFK